ncbi:MAG TPA: Crp/Fnr family transcriptional regulator [Candidatus Eisenbacteria bacterium]
MSPKARPDRCLLCEARSKNAMCQLPPDAFQRFFAGSRVESLPAGTVLFRQGDEAADIFIVRTGQVKVLFQHADGMEQLLRVAGPGDMLGVARRIGDGMAVTAVAKKGVSICRTRVDQLERTLRADADIALAWCHLLADDAERTREALFLHGPQPAATRLARLLLQTWQRNHQRDTTESRAVHLTQGEIAAALSVVEETITRLLATLEEKGVVAPGRGRIDVLDPDRLAALAGHDPPS